jgi:hypothetical protein
MIWKIILGLAIGAGLGALLGSTRSCETGGCPLTANPWRGAAYGAFVGLLFGLSMAGSSPAGERETPDEALTEQTEQRTMPTADHNETEPADRAQ